MIDDLLVGESYSVSDLSSLKMFRFLPRYSFWTDKQNVYVFHHTIDVDKRFELKYVLPYLFKNF